MSYISCKQSWFVLFVYITYMRQQLCERYTRLKWPYTIERTSLADEKWDDYFFVLFSHPCRRRPLHFTRDMSNHLFALLFFYASNLCKICSPSSSLGTNGTFFSYPLHSRSSTPLPLTWFMTKKLITTFVDKPLGLRFSPGGFSLIERPLSPPS